MATTAFNSTHQISYVQENVRPSLVQRFFTWCKNQEENRLKWLGFSLAFHGCFLTPLTMIAILFSGLNLILIYGVIGAIGATLIPNLAAQTTKVTLPIFFFSVLVDLAILIYCAVIGFSTANVY
jgi:hypothetical protein